MQIILSDHNCEGQAKAIFQALDHQGFLPTFPMALTFFLQVGLHLKASDRQVWQFGQDNAYLLLTGNRTADDGTRSLEYVISALLKEDSLPVITIGNLKRMMADPIYGWRCAENRVEIILNLERVRGTPRLYIPSHAVRR